MKSLLKCFLRILRALLRFFIEPVTLFVLLYLVLAKFASSVTPTWRLTNLIRTAIEGVRQLSDKEINIYILLCTPALIFIDLFRRYLDRIVEYILNPLLARIQPSLPLAEITNQSFPFRIFRTSNMEDLKRERLGEYASLNYIQRCPAELQRILLRKLMSNKYILITGRSGIGKTRECIELFRLLAEECGEEFTILCPNDHFDRPAPHTIPPDLAPRHLVLFIDDIHQLCTPKSKGSKSNPLERDFHDRLAATIEWMKYRFSGRDIRVILTALNEPKEKEKIRPDAEIWSSFVQIPMPAIHRDVKPRFICTVAEHFHLDTEEDAVLEISKRSDGTPMGILTAIKAEGARSGRSIRTLTLADISKYTFQHPQDWEQSVYREQIERYPPRLAAFLALSTCYLFRAQPLDFLVVDLGARLFQRAGRRWYRPISLRGARRLISETLRRDLDAWVFDHRGEYICPTVYIEGRITLDSALPIFMSSVCAAALHKDERRALLSNLSGISRRIGMDLNHAEKALEILKAFESEPSAELQRIQSILLASRRMDKESLYYAEKACEADPSSSASLIVLASALSSLRLDAEAIDASRRATEVAPFDDYAWLNLGVILSKRNYEGQAVEALLKATQINPGNAKAFYSLGIAYDRLGKQELAIQACKRAVKLDPDDKDPWQVLGIALDRAGNHADAISALQNAARLDPGNGYLMLSLSRAMAAAGQDSKARLVLEVAERIFRKASDYDSLGTLAIIYSNNDRSKAEELSREILSHQPLKHNTLRKASFALAIALKSSQGRENESEEAAAHLFELCRSATDWHRLCYEYRTRGYHREAAEAASQGIAHFPLEFGLLRERALSLDQMAASNPHYRQEALDAWKNLLEKPGRPDYPVAQRVHDAAEMVKLDPYWSETWKTLAKAYLASGKTNEAVDFAIDMLDQDPKVTRGCVALAEVVLNVVPSSVVKLMQKLISLDTQNGHYFHLLGVARSKEGSLQLAVDALRIGCRLSPRNPHYAYALGRALHKSGKIDDARNAYRKAIQLDPVYSKAQSALRELGEERPKS
jgi:tetratricopeptide (TPR) repeat protein